MNELKTIARKTVLRLAQPDIAFYTLIWLMVLLVLGTIAQKYIGLYQAENLFFSSYVLWLGFVPLPGGIPTLALLTVNITAKLLFDSPWSTKKMGVILSHAGVLLLLLGGLVTFMHAQEGYMDLEQGEEKAAFEDYHLRTLIIENAHTGEMLESYDWPALREGAVFDLAEQGLQIELLKACRHCEFVPREEQGSDMTDTPWRGMARRFDIQALPLQKIDEENRAAIQFRVTGTNTPQDGIYFSADFIDKAPIVEKQGQRYRFALRHKPSPLPFSVKLLSFEKRYHPGTMMAKHYSSEVLVRDGDLEWRSVISMNEPLRYRGYTFYQSSFVSDGQSEASVLAVVKNVGRLFPYIASAIMCIGLLIHLIMRLPKLVVRAD